jgi:hypothetical protein
MRNVYYMPAGEHGTPRSAPCNTCIGTCMRCEIVLVIPSTGHPILWCALVPKPKLASASPEYLPIVSRCAVRCRQSTCMLRQYMRTCVLTSYPAPSGPDGACAADFTQQPHTLLHFYTSDFHWKEMFPLPGSLRSINRMTRTFRHAPRRKEKLYGVVAYIAGQATPEWSCADSHRVASVLVASIHIQTARYGFAVC